MKWNDLQSYNAAKEVVNSLHLVNDSDKNGVKLCFVYLDTSKKLKAITKHSLSG